MLERLKKEVRKLGKPEWRPILEYVAELHEKSIHPVSLPFIFDWEEIGPGYCYGPAFGHWDIVHMILDVLPSEPEHAKNQILNNLHNQEGDGFVPGVIWMRRGERPHWNKICGHPPLWQISVKEYCEMTGDSSLIRECYPRLIKLIGWYERNRKAKNGGFFYLDIVERAWESGTDDGIRFDVLPPEPEACVDAASHVYWLYEYAARWSEEDSVESSRFKERADALKKFMQEELFDEETGFFHDKWSVRKRKVRRLSFDGMWPFVVGVATPEQARRVIDENLLNPERFFTKHPISSVAVSDPHFELRMWRGPTWNSMTYWAARGCARYGRKDAAVKLLEAALDASAREFSRSKTIWEFYHPFGGDPLLLQRKPYTAQNTPCKDYLGHNPLIAMARLWEVVL